MTINYAQINLRDQIRKGNTVPVQFIYEAANCRIFYTPQTFYNYTNLWKFAAEAIWTNSSLCVKNSTGYATTNTTDTTGPPIHLLPSATAAPTSPVKLGSVIMSLLGGPATKQTILHDSTGSTHKKTKLGSPCNDKTNPCSPSDRWYCWPKYVSGCDKKGKPIFTPGCVHTCTPVGDYCGYNNNCAAFQNSTMKKPSKFKHQEGFCPPPSLCQQTSASGVPGKYQGGGGA